MGGGVQSETQEVAIYETQLDGKLVSFIDTPGFDDTYRTDAQVLEQVGSWLGKSYENGYKINGLIYLHRITDNRMQGTNPKNLRMFKKLVGDSSLKNVVLATTMWDLVTPEDGEAREADLKARYWDQLVRFGMQVRRLDRAGANWSIVDELMKNIDPQPLLIQTELVDDRKTLDQTTAGKEVLSEITKATEEMKSQLNEITEELRKTKDSSEKNMQELRSVMKHSEYELKSKLDQAEKDRKILKNDMAEFHVASRKNQAELSRRITEAKRDTNEQRVTAEIKAESARLENLRLRDKLKYKDAELEYKNAALRGVCCIC